MGPPQEGGPRVLNKKTHHPMWITNPTLCRRLLELLFLPWSGRLGMAVLSRPASRKDGARRHEGTLAHAPLGRDASSKWRGAGDAIVAVHRLNKTMVKAPGVSSAPVVSGKSTALVVKEDKAAAHQLTASSQQTAKHGLASQTAAKKGDATSLQRLIDSHPAAADWEDENSVTPLLLAASYGNLACTEVLCAAGARIDQKNCWGSTPLINAAHNAQVDVVRHLILAGAQVSIRDKDGTALDSALLRLAKMVRGVCAATDDKHPDKPGLQKVMQSLNDLNRQNNRGPVWMQSLQAAFGVFRPILEQAPAAATWLAFGKATAPAAGPSAPSASESGRSSQSGQGKAKKKSADAGEPPDSGRCALYAGCAGYMRCIEMLREPSAVRRDERLRTGVAPPQPSIQASASNAASAGGAQLREGLSQQVGRIRTALAIDVALPLPEVIREANRLMGTPADGSLPEQAERLIDLLGLQ